MRGLIAYFQHLINRMLLTFLSPSKWDVSMSGFYSLITHQKTVSDTVLEDNAILYTDISCCSDEIS